jgi:MarR family transcriptional regulator, organic hydroperoxide resistance regulator
VRVPIAKPQQKSSSLGEPLEFMRLIWALSHAMQSRSKRMAIELGVTGPQRFVIRLVGKMPAMSAGSLAELLHVHPSTLTGVLQRLEDRGFLSRTVAADDRRKAVLTLTPAGAAVDARKAGTVEASLRNALASARKADVEAARRVLTALARELGGTLEL